MSEEVSSQVLLLDRTINTLGKVREKLDTNDFAIAQIMTGVAAQMLMDLLIDLEEYLTIQKQIQEALGQDCDFI